MSCLASYSFHHSLLFQTLCRRPSILQIHLSDLVTLKSRKCLKTCILNHLKQLCWRKMLSTDTPESYTIKVYFIEHRERLKWLAQKKSVPRCRPLKPWRWVSPPSNDSLTLISKSGSTGRRLTLQWLEKVNESKRKIEPLKNRSRHGKGEWKGNHKKINKKKDTCRKACSEPNPFLWLLWFCRIELENWFICVFKYSVFSLFWT